MGGGHPGGGSRRAAMNIPPATRSIGPLDRQSDPRAPRLALTLARLIEQGGRLRAIEDVYATVAEELATLVTFERLSISVFDPVTEVMRIDYNASALPDIPPVGSRHPLAESIAGEVFRSRKPIIHVVGNAAEFPADAGRQARGIQEVAVAPIVVDEVAYGAIAISSVESGRYTPADLWILTTLANLLGMMVSGVTLRREAQAKRQSAELLARVARQLAGLREATAISTALVDLLANVFGKTTIVFLTTDDGRFTVDAVRAADPELTARATTIATSLCELPRSRIDTLRARTGPGQPLIIRASESAPDVADELYHFGDYGIDELVVMPLFAGDDLLGTITVMELDAEDEDRLARLPMTAEQCTLLSLVAEQAAPALVNVRLHESLQRAYHESETLRRIGQELARSHDTRQALDLACRAVFALFNADYAGVVRLMPDGSMHWETVIGNRTGRHAHGPISRSLVGPIKDGRVLVIQDFPHDIATSIDDYPVTVAEGFRSSLVVPIMVAGESVGGLAIAFRSRRPIREGDIRMGQALAQTMASAVQAITSAPAPGRR